MSATADELRYELVARIARPRLLEVRDRYSASFLKHAESQGVHAWTEVYRSECDAVLDEALDVADTAILHHSLAISGS